MILARSLLSSFSQETPGFGSSERILDFIVSRGRNEGRPDAKKPAGNRD